VAPAKSTTMVRETKAKWTELPRMTPPRSGEASSPTEHRLESDSDAVLRPRKSHVPGYAAVRRQEDEMRESIEVPRVSARAP
jgi:hypothetical protein